MKLTAILVSLVCLTQLSAEAAPLATYNPAVNGHAGSPPDVSPATDVDPNATATSLILGPGLTSTIKYADPTYFAFIGNVSGQIFPATLAGAESDGTYVTFSIAPQAGDFLDLTDLDFDSLYLGRLGGTSRFYLQSSVGGFGSSAPVLEEYTSYDSDPAFPGKVALGSQFSDLTSSTEFRIYVTSQADSPNDPSYADIGGTGGMLYIDGLAETLTVPEPSAYALFGFGLCLVCAVEIKRRLAKP